MIPTSVDSPILVGLIGTLGFGYLTYFSVRYLPAFRYLIALGNGFFSVLALTTCAWGAWVASADGAATSRQLAPNLAYERLSLTGEDITHLVTIDLANQCTQLITTDIAFDGDVTALKTETWAEQESALVAMNASFFAPYLDRIPWDIYPAEGDEVRILGFAVVDSEPRGMPRNWQGMWSGQNVFINGDNRPGIAFDFPADSTWAVTGRERILANGEVVAGRTGRYPRSVVAVNADTQTMWWLVTDGKQPGYSEGVSLASAAKFLGERGATDALEMDGGGSSILVDGTGPEAQQLSRPMNQFVPGWSRVVANHIGVIDGCA